MTKDLEYIIKVRDEATGNLKAMAGAAIVATAALAGIGMATNEAIKFESSFAGIRKTVDASEEEFAELSKRMRKLALEIPVNVNQLNAIGEMAGQLGVRGVDDLTKFTEVVAKIAVTTNLTEDAAATSFARISNIIGEPIQNIDRMASSVVDLGNNFATTESEIVEFATRIAGAGKIAGLTSSDIFGIGAAMTSVGVRAEAGGTSVQKVLNSITQAVATNNEELGVFASTAGMTAEEFAKAWETNAAGAFTAFVEGFGQQGAAAFQTLDDLELNNERVITSFLSLSGAGDLLAQTLQVSGDAFAENTALATEADKRFETMAKKSDLLNNAIINLQITIGGLLQPVLGPMIAAATEMAIRMGEWAETHPKLAQFIVLTVAALAIMVMIITSLQGVIIGFASLAMAGFGAVTVAIVAAVAAIATAAIAIIVFWDEISAGAQRLWEKMTLIWNLGVFAIQVAWSLLYEKMAKEWAEWSNMMKVAWSEYWKSIAALFGIDTKAVSIAWDIMMNLIKSTFDTVVGGIRQEFADFFAWVNSSIAYVISSVSSIGTAISSAMSSFNVSKRAVGGFTSGATLVGEAGPELIFPPSGSFVANSQNTNDILRKGGGSNITINVSGSLIGMSQRELASMIGEQIMMSMGSQISRAA